MNGDTISSLYSFPHQNSPDLCPQAFHRNVVHRTSTFDPKGRTACGCFCGCMKKSACNTVILKRITHTQNKASGNRHDALCVTFYSGSGKGKVCQGSHEDNCEVSRSVAILTNNKGQKRGERMAHLRGLVNKAFKGLL
jgi:hypothetical protein